MSSFLQLLLALTIITTSAKGDEVNEAQVIAASENVVGNFDAPNSGILFVMPVAYVRGLRHKK
jgi:hypothetical protein